MSYETCMASARELRQLIESEAEAIEEQSTMTEAVVSAIAEAGLFRLVVPAGLGGLEADTDTIIDVAAELSYADGSVGWAFAQNTTVMAYSAYLSGEHAKTLANAKAAAGMFAPMGVAEKQDGGYRISGNYQFGSGSGHAEFMGGAALLMENGEMAPFEGDRPQIIGFIVPMENVTMKGNWDVMGLRGTGSYDFEVPEQLVNSDSTFSVFSSETVTGGAIYGLGPVVLGTISSAGWAIGVAKRALQEITTIASAGRARLGSDPLAQQQVFQRDLGKHRAALLAAELLVKSAYNDAVNMLESGEAEDKIAQQIRETKAAGTHLVHVAKDAASFAMHAAGSAGIRNPGKLQRCFRDLCVGSVHQVFDERNFNDLVKQDLGLEASLF